MTSTNSDLPALMTPGQPALDFELLDINNTPVRLSGYYGRKVVVLCFLRGFM